MRKKWDFLLFSQIISIGAISVLIISSINSSLAASQLLFWSVGLLILIIVSQFDYHGWQNYAVWFYIASIIILIGLLLFSEPIRGSVRWVDLGFFRFQPSEIAKAAVILIMATFYSRRPAKYLKNLLLGLLIIIPTIALIFFEPDVGNTLAIIAIWLGTSFVAGMRLKHVVVLVVITLVLGALFFEILAPYQKERIESFLNPVSDPLGTGYNLIQSRIAIGSGQFFGKGYGQGSQSQLNFLPEAESDFIFASIAEQLGFLGSSLLIILFTWLIFRIISATNYTDLFGRLILIGVASYLQVQFLVNVGMNMGLLPVTGITFPLVSYGGSSLITNLFLFGIIFSIIRRSG